MNESDIQSIHDKFQSNHICLPFFLLSFLEAKMMMMDRPFTIRHLRKCLLPQNISIQSHLNLMCLPFFSLSFVISANAYHIGKLPPPSWWEGRLIKRQKTLSQSIQIINLAINLRKDYLNLSSLETEKEQWDGNPNGKESHNRGRYKVFWMTVNYGRLTYRPYFLSTRSMRQKNYPNGFFSQFEIHQPNITF